MINKKILLAALAVFIGAVPVMALSPTYFEPGTLDTEVGAGYFWGGFVDLEGGVDYSIDQVDISPEFPLDLGVSGRLAVGTGGVGAGIFATAHYSWKALHTKLEWLNHLETYVGLGLDVLPRPGFDAFGGFDYHFNDHWALFLEGANSGTIIGAQYRF